MSRILAISTLTLAILLPAWFAEAQPPTRAGTIQGLVSESPHVLRMEEPAAADKDSILNLAQQLGVTNGPVEETDPEGLLERQHMGALVDLATRLSQNRSWLTGEALESLDRKSLSLDEVFSQAPEFLSWENKAFRVKIEKIGDLWKRFDPKVDPFVVFINHEVYDGLGEDSALAFQDGAETVIFERDLESLPAVALTLDEDNRPVTGLQPLDAPIALGAARLQVRREPAPAPSLTSASGALLHNLPSGNSCAPELAPTSCAGGVPVCTAGYDPFFVLKNVMIKVDHESWARGKPEIELFPLNLDSLSPSGGTSATTPWLFKGQQVLDLAGRSRYLQDVNNEYTRYEITGGLAISPLILGNEWNATLVEDDNDPGVLRVSGAQPNHTRIFNSTVNIITEVRGMNRFWMVIRNIGQILIDIIPFFNNDDDLFQPSLGLTNNLFCSSGIGQPFPRIYTLPSVEWEIQGYFACVNPSCTGTGGGGGGGGGGGDPDTCPDDFPDELAGDDGGQNDRRYCPEENPFPEPF
ncbi:MAG: hypothetical protein K0U98_00335 [Deltaproteobacteria bacterium]|nr:hypothetical protein [Deltaproteobacteria bacterium]